MEWLLILGLVVWAIVLHMRLGRLESRLAAQELILKAWRESAAAPPSPKPALTRPAAAAPAPTLLAEARELSDGAIVGSGTPAPRATAPAPKATSAPAPKGPPKPASDGEESSIASWLSENGLAWIGGGALTLGGLLLVAYAAQRGFFTPGMRLAAAGVLGFGMIGASEWIRRIGAGAGGPHRLAAAVTAGAGAATLYGAVLAAHGVYHYIDVQAATALLALISLGLLGLSFFHGEPLAILALGGGFAAPLIGLDPGWEQPILFAYLLLVTLTGVAVASSRRWNAAAILTLAAAGGWAGLRAGGGENLGPALLVLAPAAVILLRRWRSGEAARELGDWRADPQVALIGALVMPALILPLTWPLGWAGSAGDLAVAAPASGLLAAFAAAAAWRRLTHGGLYTLACASCLAGWLKLLVAGIGETPDMTVAGGAVVLSIAVAAAGLAAARRGEPKPLIAAAAAATPVAFVALLWLALSWKSSWASGFAALAAVALAAGSVALARWSQEPRRDPALGAWVAGAATALFVALQAGVETTVLPIAFAAAAAAIAVLARRLDWSAVSGAATAAGVLTLAAMLNPGFATAVLSRDLSSLEVAAITAAAAGLLAAGWRVVRGREGLLNAAEALGTAALTAGLLGAFWLLRQWAEGKGAPLDEFTEASLRTLLLLLAGLAVVSPADRVSGVIGRWRTHVFLVAGVAHGLIFQVLLFNPLFYGTEALGWPVANTLLLAYLAPAAVLAFAVARTLRGGRGWRGPYALAGFLSAVLWLLMEVRRLFHGPEMAIGSGPLGWSEAAAYGLAALLVSQAVLWFGRRLDAQDAHPRARAQVRALGHGGAWASLAVSLYVFGLIASPWWGPIGGRPSGAQAGLLFALYAAGAAAAAWLAWPAARRGWRRLRSAAIAAALVQLFVLITLLIRWFYQGGDMRRPMPEESLQTWTYSAVWAVYGVLVLTGGMARRNLAVRWVGLAILLLTTAKVFLFDMAMLEGVIRAASFLALGALLIGGALISRRLRDVAGLSFGKPKDGASAS